MGEVVTTFFLIAPSRLSQHSTVSEGLHPQLFPFLRDNGALGGRGIRYQRESCSQFGPAVISGEWHGWWIYWVGPLIGGLLALLVCNSLSKRIEVAKLYHFDSDPEGRIRRVNGRTLQELEHQGQPPSPRLAIFNL